MRLKVSAFKGPSTFDRELSFIKTYRRHVPRDSNLAVSPHAYRKGAFAIRIVRQEGSFNPSEC